MSRSVNDLLEWGRDKNMRAANALLNNGQSPGITFTPMICKKSVEIARGRRGAAHVRLFKEAARISERRSIASKKMTDGLFTPKINQHSLEICLNQAPHSRSPRLSKINGIDKWISSRTPSPITKKVRHSRISENIDYQSPYSKEILLNSNLPLEYILEACKPRKNKDVVVQGVIDLPLKQQKKPNRRSGSQRRFKKHL